MLDAYVIEEIKRREREQRRDDRPVIELPIPQPAHRPGGEEPADRDDGRKDRGVVIIDLG
ncbi:MULTISPECIES: hypothetical protein [Anaeromyxobacter]|uniref:hypothetical protein n=1 Tax=Anaeromyxobacter TaxID=161492 RepID=UPI001F5927DE|nr:MULTISPECIES: hypothetical protein [unclassified Anaeromyxobacter]